MCCSSLHRWRRYKEKIEDGVWTYEVDSSVDPFLQRTDLGVYEWINAEKDPAKRSHRFWVFVIYRPDLSDELVEVLSGRREGGPEHYGTAPFAAAVRESGMEGAFK